MTKSPSVAVLAAILITTSAKFAFAQQAPAPKAFPEKHPDPPQVIRMMTLPAASTCRSG